MQALQQEVTDLAREQMKEKFIPQDSLASDPAFATAASSSLQKGERNSVVSSCSIPSWWPREALRDVPSLTHSPPYQPWRTLLVEPAAHPSRREALHHFHVHQGLDVLASQRLILFPEFFINRHFSQGTAKTRHEGLILWYTSHPS